MRLFIVLSSVFAVGLCAGGWTRQDPADQQWCTSFTALASHVSSFSSFTNGCPKIVSVSTQVVSGMNYIMRYEDGNNVCTLKWYEQSWTQTYQVKEQICSQHATLSQTHPMPGGNMDQDPTKAEFTDMLFNFTSMGLLNMDSMNGILITKVQTQVVSGENYKYTLQMGSQVCHLTLYVQPWTNTFQVSTDSCHLASAPKRQLGGGGHWESQDPTDQQYVTLLKTVSSQITNTMMDYSLICQITSVDTQVVSGMNYKYNLTCGGHNCHLELYVQSWTNTYQVKVDSCAQNKGRQLGGGLLGSWQPVKDTSKAGYQDCLKATMDGINSQSNSMYRMVESNVQAKSQMVAGTKYDITVAAGMSTCMNNDGSMGKLLAECPMDATNMMAPTHWHAVCMYQGWMDQKVNLISLDMTSH